EEFLARPIRRLRGRLCERKTWQPKSEAHGHAGRRRGKSCVAVDHHPKATQESFSEAGRETSMRARPYALGCRATHSLQINRNCANCAACCKGSAAGEGP